MEENNQQRLDELRGDAHALASAKPLSTAELEDATGLKARP